MAHVTAAKDGSYAISLPAGVYTVSVASMPWIGRGITPDTVSVVAAQHGRVDFSIDTGIR